MHGAFLEMKRRCLKNVGTEIIPGFGLREDGVAECSRPISTFFCVANFEDATYSPGRYGVLMITSNESKTSSPMYCVSTMLSSCSA